MHGGISEPYARGQTWSHNELRYKRFARFDSAKVLRIERCPLKSAKLLWTRISAAGSVVPGPTSKQGCGKSGSPRCLGWGLGLHIPGCGGAFCMCYTEADCSASALLHGHSGQADGNFVRKGADVASIFCARVLLPEDPIPPGGGKLRSGCWK